MLNKKKNKRLGKKCPLCEGILEIVTRSENKQGVLYSEKYIECLECDYKEKIKNNHNGKEKEEDFDINGW
jgi:uncharacterized protein with PIN domain